MVVSFDTAHHPDHTSRKSRPRPAGSIDGGWVLAPWLPVLLLISFSTCRMKFSPPPAGENTIVSRGHWRIPKQQTRSGFPADRGHIQKGVDGTVVTMQTPSVGSDKKPRCGRQETTEHGVSRATRRSEMILSKGTSISMFPIQKRNALSVVISTDRTKLYQNQATSKRLTSDTATTVPCAPIGTAATIKTTKITSKRMNRILNPADKKIQKNG